MNWKYLRHCAWLDTRAGFVATTPPRGTLLDLGSSDGETLNHIAELRPDLRLCSADKFGHPEHYPSGCDFQRCDFVKDRLPWPDGSMDAITCMHVVEHLDDLQNLLAEIARLLKPGGHVYFETPHPKTVDLPSAKGKFTLNFFDDPTHLRVVTMAEMAKPLTATGLRITRSGISRNWLFAAAHPLYCLRPESRKKFTARVHWIGWSAYLVARKPK
jgi:SAM-dependent methyltransferase